MSVYVYEIEMSNFKSFAGTWKIGPLKPHSSNVIIGTNGTGKSNIIDAIAFCMGEKSTSLRIKRVEDLISKASVCEDRSSYVAVTFQFENGNKNIFKRSIINNLSQYEIDDQIIVKKEYHMRLQSLNINMVKNNCIVYQNHISSISMANADERTILFEQMSNSVKLKEKYDYYKKKLEEMSDKTKKLQDEKRILTVDRKNLLYLQTEQSKQLDLQREYERAMIQLPLFNLYIIKLRLEENEKDLIRIRKEGPESEARKMEIEEKLENKKKEMIELTHAKTVVINKISKGQEELSHRVENLTSSVETLKKFQEKLKRAKKELESARKADASYKDNIEKLENDLSETMEAKNRFVQQNFSQKFDEEQRQWDRQYDQLKAIAMTTAAEFYQEKNLLEREMQPLMDKLENETRRQNDIDLNILKKKKKYEDIEKRMNTMESNMRETEEKIQSKQTLYEKSKLHIDSSEEKRKSLERKIKDIVSELDSMKLSDKQSKKIAKETEMMKILRQTFPGVHDRVHKLMKPFHSRYKIAFTKIFGPYFSNIVVDSTKTAMDCIQYLKINQIGISTFLPLDTLKVKKLKENLRSLGQRENIRDVKLLYDVIQFPPEIEKSVRYITRNILVCETDENAKHIAYNTHNDCVALDGTYYLANGLFSGGTATLTEKSNILDAEKQEQLEVQKNKMLDDLKKLPTEIEKSDLKILENEIEMSLKLKLRFFNNALENMKKESKKEESELEKLNRDSHVVKEIISKIERDIGELNEKIEAVQIEINTIDDEVFAQFCSSKNITNIRKYEESLKSYKEMKLKELEYDNQCNRINDLLKYEKKRNPNENVEKWSENVDNIFRQIEEHGIVEKDAREKYNKGKNLLEKYDKTLEDTNDAMENLQKEIINDEKELKKESEYLATLDQKLLADKMMEQCEQRHNILIEAKIQGISLPLVDGTTLDIDNSLISEEYQLTSQLVGIYERQNKFEFDYTHLEEKPESVADEVEISRIYETYKEKLNNLESKISALTEFKASQELEEVNKKLQKLNQTLGVTSKLAKDVQKSFYEVKQNRSETFMNYFESVAAGVNEVYKEMNGGDESAQALLYPENPEEPYLGGIHYDCIPPKKRFRPRDLSGGEVSVASLALIFAIQSKNPSPFLLLDEIDAALDPTNRKNIAKYMQNSKIHGQVLIISHHKEFFSISDTLIGVYPSQNSSQSESKLVMLDLSVYF